MDLLASSQVQLLCTMPHEYQLSQSRTWTSPEFQKVKDFNRMKEKMHHLGLGNSPFIPATPSELIGLRAEILASKAVKIAARLREKERLAANRSNGIFPEQEPQLFGGKAMLGDLSAVFSLSLVWNSAFLTETAPQDNNNTDDEPLSSWPTLAEYKAWGCVLPLPRSILNSAAAEMAEKEACWMNPETLGRSGSKKVSVVGNWNFNTSD